MGQPAAKKHDTVASNTPGDVHIVVPPTGTPAPVPHPCTSIIKSKVVGTVKVTGLPGAVKGSISKHSPPHVPMVPGTFQKPPKNRGKIVTASSNVFYEGKAAAMRGDTAAMCADPVDAPVGKVMATATTVEVGGGGQGSDADRNAAAEAALAAAHAKTQLLLAGITGTGHPVDVGSGALVITAEDLSLPSPLPIQFVRTYVSARSGLDGPMGYGWVHNFQEQLELVNEGDADWDTVHGIYVEAGDPSPSGRYVTYRDPNGVAAHYHAPEPERNVSDSIRRRQLGYDARAGVFWIRDRRGKQTRFVRPAGARAGHVLLPAEAHDRNGNRTLFHYDADGRLREVQDCYDRRVLLTYATDGHLTELAFQPAVSHPVRRWCSYRYDEHGDLVEVVDVAGASTKYACADHLIVEDRNRDGYSFYFAYDRERRCVTTWGQDGYLTRYLAYDAQRQQTREINGEGETTIYHLTEQGAVTRIEKGAEGLATEETTFDAAGRPLTRTQQGVDTMSVQYDEDGNVSEVMDAEHQSTTFTYNAFGQVTSKAGPAGDVERFRYDERGNMLEREDAQGTVTRYERDERGRTIAEHGPGARVVLTRYDAFGNITSRGNGTHETLVEADAMGNVLKVAASGLPHVTFEWDALGRLTRKTTGEYVTARAEYTAEGYPISQLDARGLLHRYVYGAPGVVTEYRCYAAPASARRVSAGPAQAADEAGLLVRIEYDRDTEGRPRKATDSMGRTREFAVDARGHLCGVTSSESGRVELRRDERGLITGILAPGDVDDRFEFDARGRVTKARYRDELTDTYEWNDAGRLAAAANGVVQLTYEYDDVGRQIVRRQGDFELSAEVDDVGGTVVWTMPDGPSRHYELDDAGRTRAITFGDGRFSVARDEFGTILATTFPNGVTQSFAQDGYGRLVATRVTGPAHASPSSASIELFRQDVVYRTSDGRVESVDDSRRGRWQYDYDSKDRLVRAGVEFYRFDDRDNLVASHARGDSRATGDQLLAAGRREYAYDARGCVVSISEEDRRWGLEHDAKGQLARVRLPDGGDVEYRYDALGRRVAKVFTGGARDGRIVRFFWDADTFVKEEHRRADDDEADGPLLERFYLFNGVAALARIDRDSDGERSLYFHNDHTGRPQLCTGDDGKVVWEWRGDSFGADVDSGAIEQHIRLPGQYFDEETGLCYNRHRYYDARAGRYLEPDPIVRPTDVNRYAYPTDPMSRIDPTGTTTAIVVTDWRDAALNGGYVDQSNEPGGGYVGEYDGVAPRVSTGHGGALPTYMHDVQPPDLTGVRHVLVVGHGDSDNIEIREPNGAKRNMEAKELAQYLKDRGLTPKDGVTVTLVSCSTGKARADGSSVGRDLAQELGPGAVVWAPTDYLSVEENGDFEVKNNGKMQRFVYQQPPPEPPPAPEEDTKNLRRGRNTSDTEDTANIRRRRR